MGVSREPGSIPEGLRVIHRGLELAWAWEEGGGVGLQGLLLVSASGLLLVSASADPAHHFLP